MSNYLFKLNSLPERILAKHVSSTNLSINFDEAFLPTSVGLGSVFSLSSWRSYLSSLPQRVCTLVSPRHGISVRHSSWHPRVGETVRFIDKNNKLFQSKVIRVDYLSGDVSVITWKDSFFGNFTKVYLPDVGDNTLDTAHAEIFNTFEHFAVSMGGAIQKVSTRIGPAQGNPDGTWQWGLTVTQWTSPKTRWGSGDSGHPVFSFKDGICILSSCASNRYGGRYIGSFSRQICEVIEKDRIPMKPIDISKIQEINERNSGR